MRLTSLKGSLIDIRKRIDELSKLLYTDNPVEIKFTDEPEYTYYGVKENVEENLEKSNIHQGTITLVCLFPYKVGDLKRMILSRNGLQKSPHVLLIKVVLNRQH